MAGPRRKHGRAGERVNPVLPQAELRDLCSRLVEIRMAAGATQNDLAEWTGINRTIINLLESGARQATAEYLLCIGAALGVNPGWILIGEGEKYVAEFPRRSALSLARHLRSLEVSVLGVITTTLRHSPVTSHSIHQAVGIGMGMFVADPDLDGPRAPIELAAMLDVLVERLGLDVSKVLEEVGSMAGLVQTRNLATFLMHRGIDPGAFRIEKVDLSANGVRTHVVYEKERACPQQPLDLIEDGSVRAARKAAEHSVDILFLHPNYQGFVA